VGRPIVYCDVCGDRILEEAFEKRQALSVQNKSYCPTCAKNVFGSAMPDQETPKPRPATAAFRPDALRPPSSTNLRQARPPAQIVVHHRPHAPRSGPPLGLIIGGAAGAVALVVIVLVAASSGSGGAQKPAPPPASKEPTKEDRAREAMAQIERAAGPEITDPVEPEQVLTLADRHRAVIEGTSFESRLQLAERMAKEKRARASKREEISRLLAEVRSLAAADPGYAQYDRAQELLRKADDLARDAGRVDDVFAATRDYNGEFQRAASRRFDDVKARAEQLARDGRPADAARAIDAEFTGAWRKSSYWPTLESRKRELEQLAARPPDVPPPPNRGGKDQFGLPVADPPKAGAWVDVLKADGFAAWTRLISAGEKRESWALENGELIGRSSKEATVEGEYADMFASLCNSYTDLELEFTVRAESGSALLGVRYEPGTGTNSPRVAAAIINPSAEYTKVRVVVEGNTGRVIVGGQENPLDLSAGAPTGRVVFGVSSGATVRFKELKILRRK
jgi:hypothetical protein